MSSSGWFLLRSYVFVLPVFPVSGGGFCPWTMEVRSAKRSAKPPASPGQQDELLTLHSSADEEDEEDVYGFFCQRSSERSPEDEPDYASIDDDSSPSLGRSFPRRTWEHHPRFISLMEDRAGHRGDATSKNKFFGSGEVLAFNELSQTKHGHALEQSEAHPMRQLRLLQAGLGRDHDIPDWEEDEDNAFSLSPGETKAWPGWLVSVSVFQTYSQPESRCFRAG